MRRRPSWLPCLLVLILLLSLPLPSRAAAGETLTVKWADAKTQMANPGEGWAEIVNLLDNPAAVVRPDVTELDLTLNRELDAANLASNLTLTDSQGRPVALNAPRLAGSDAYIGNYEYSLTLSVPLQSHASYTLLLRGGATGVHDGWGNTLPSDIHMPFTTSAPPPPPPAQFAVQQVMVAGMAQITDGMVLPRIPGDIGVQFTHPIDRRSANGNLTLTDSHGRVPRFNQSGAGITFQEPLQRSETYTLVLKGGPGGIKDEHGQPLAADYRLTFKTDDAPATMALQAQTSWDIAGVRQMDAFVFEAAAGPLRVALPRDLDDAFRVMLEYDPPGQPAHGIDAVTLDAEQNVDVKWTLPVAGRYRLLIYPQRAFTPEPKRTLTIEAPWLDRWPAPSVPIIQVPPVNSGSGEHNTPFDWPVTLQAPAAANLRVYLDGRLLREEQLAAGKTSTTVRVDPSDLGDGLHAVSVAAESSGNHATWTQQFIVDRLSHYVDVSRAHWAHQAVELMTSLGVVRGRTTNGLFEPDLPTTRAEFAKMLALTLGLQAPDQSPVFADMPESAWFAPYVKALADQGIVQGAWVNGLLYFHPDQTISREEAAALLARALKVEPADIKAPTATFTDFAAVQTWAKDAVAALTRTGLLSGFPDGSFKPQGTLDRAQAAQVLASVASTGAPVDPADRRAPGLCSIAYNASPNLGDDEHPRFEVNNPLHIEAYVCDSDHVQWRLFPGAGEPADLSQGMRVTSVIQDAMGQWIIRELPVPPQPVRLVLLAEVRSDVADSPQFYHEGTRRWAVLKSVAVIPAPPPQVTDLPATGWTGYRGNAQRTAYNPAATLGASAAPLWQNNTLAARGGAALGDGRLYISGHDGYTYALNPDTGAVIWKVRPTTWEGAYIGPPTYDPIRRQVYVGVDGPHYGHLYALDAATGQTRWVVITDEEYAADNAAPAVLGSAVVIAVNGMGTKLYAFDAVTGREIYRRDSADSIVPAVGQGRIFASGGGNAMATYRAVDGSSLWEHPRTDGGFGGVAAPLVLGGEHIYAVDGDVTAFDAATGRVLWKQPSAALPTSPAFDGQYLWVETWPMDGRNSSSRITVLDAATGAVVHKVDVCGNPVVGRTHAFTACNGTIYAIDRTTFAVTALAPGQNILAIDGDRLYYRYVESNQESLRALRAQ